MRKKLFIPIFAAIFLLFSACQMDNSTAEESETVLSVPSETTLSKTTTATSETEISQTTAAATGETTTSQTTTAATSETTLSQTTAAETSDYKQNILMFSINENEAWGYYQYLTILDADGSCYRIYTEDEEQRFNLRNNGNWYEQLENIAAEREIYGRIDSESLNLICEYTGKFGEYVSYPVKDFLIDNSDFGFNRLYGIYLDENNTPIYIELCCYGDSISCIDNEDIINFINLIDPLPMELSEPKDGFTHSNFYVSDFDFDFFC